MNPPDGMVCIPDPQFGRLTIVENIGGPGGPLPLRANPCGPMDAATMEWTLQAVNAQVCGAIQALLQTYPSVWSWGGRVGDVWLTLNDVERVFFMFPGVYPQSPTPPPTSNDQSIATTAWVTGTIGTLVEDAITSQNLASQTWVLANTVNSFNSRQGIVTLALSDVTQVGGAPLNSPNFSGVPQGPTANPGTSTSQLATTAFVMSAVTESTTGVVSFNGRTGEIVLSSTDVYNAGGALLISPAFTGTPTAPTAAVGTSTTQIATTAFVAAAIASVTTGVASFNGRSGVVTLAGTDITSAGGALLASPTFTGTPSGPTAVVGTDTNQFATTAFVQAAIAQLAPPAGVDSFNGRTGIVTLSTNDLTAVGGLVNPNVALSGTPTAPTPAPGDNSTAVATTAFVEQALANISTVTSFNTRTGAVTLTAADLTAVGGALLNGPVFVGVPTAPTASPGTSTTQLATTAFVAAAVATVTTGVVSFNTRTGAVTLTAGDVSGVGGALLASPTFTGTPTAPTATAGTSTSQIATTAFVQQALSAAGGVSSFNSRTGAITLTSNDLTAAGGALLVSPAFSGTPTAPTAVPGTSTTQLATTAFVAGALAGVTGITVSATAPASPVQGAGWYNLNDGQTYIWTGSTWAIAVNPPMPDLSGYLPLTGGIINPGPLIITATATAFGPGQLQVNGTAGTLRQIDGQTAGVERWQLQLGNLVAETGSNVGSDFVIVSCADNGSLLATPFWIQRPTSIVSLANNAVFVAGNTGLGGVLTGQISLGGPIDTGSNVGAPQILGSTNMPTAFTLRTGINAIVINRGSDPIWNWQTSGGTVAWVSSTGSMYLQGTLSQGSDSTNKTNINPITQGISLVRKLLPKSFAFNSTPTTTQWGFIAQDVQPVIPAAVSTQEGGLLSLDTTAIIAALAYTVQQLDQRCSTLESAASITPPASSLT